MIDYSFLADPCNLSDINAAKRLLTQLTDHVDPISPEYFSEVVRMGNLLVARDGEKIVGMGYFCSISTLSGRKGAIHDMVVDETHRGQNIGRTIMGKLIELARSEKVGALDLTSKPSRIAANRLYQSLGFIKRKTNLYSLKL